MKRLMKIALVSFTVLAGATAAQAGGYHYHGGSSGVENFDIQVYWEEQSLQGGGL